ncbi:Methyl-accepting chemotaxis protein I (serine chemoreceptor protein) [plant metagenome]
MDRPGPILKNQGHHHKNVPAPETMAAKTPLLAFFRNVSIRRMTLMAMIAISLLTAGLSTLNYYAQQRASIAFDASQSLRYESATLSKANDHITRARLHLNSQQEFLAASDTARADEEAGQVEMAFALAQEYFTVFKALSSSHDAGPVAAELDRAFQAMLNQGVAPLRARLAARDLAGYHQHNMGPVVELGAALSASVNAYDAYADVYAVQLSAEASRIRDNTIQAGFVMLALCLIFLVMADRYVVQYIRTPLETVRAHFQRIAGGDLTTRIDLFGRNCVGQLLPYLRDMQASLARTVGIVRQGVDEIHTSAREIADGNNDLSSRTEQQAASLEQTAASMEELAATVKQNADNARQASALADTASDVARRGGGAMEQAVATMHDISTGSHRIGEIVGVIDSIAFQTNILALNAAVEAARAGEQGKGFAVVASEVRSLAQRSAGAAREIKDLIGSSLETVSAGARQVEEAGRTMEELVASVGRVTAIIGEIATASGEQSAGIDQVSGAVTQMDSVTQQNAALVEQASAAAASLETQAEQLQHAVAVFRIGQRDVIDAPQAPAGALPGASRNENASRGDPNPLARRPLPQLV